MTSGPFNPKKISIRAFANLWEYPGARREYRHNVGCFNGLDRMDSWFIETRITIKPGMLKYIPSLVGAVLDSQKRAGLLDLPYDIGMITNAIRTILPEDAAPVDSSSCPTMLGDDGDGLKSLPGDFRMLFAYLFQVGDDEVCGNLTRGIESARDRVKEEQGQLKNVDEWGGRKSDLPRFRFWPVLIGDCG